MKNHYIDNKRFEEIILLYQQDPKTYEEDLVSLFDLLITNIIDSFRFKVDPDDARQECFTLVLKTVFITGIEALNKQLSEMVQKYASENREELAASGITVLEGEDGEIKLAETAKLEHDVSGAIPATTPANFMDRGSIKKTLNDDIEKYNK